MTTVARFWRGHAAGWLVACALACAGLSACSDDGGAARPADAAADSEGDAADAVPDVPTGKCAVAAVCDDGNPCTIDGCDPLLGCTLQVVQCEDGDPCTIDKCDVLTGACKSAASDCDDGNACTTGSCISGEGCSWQVVDCSDGDACTSDGCSPATGCLNKTLDCNDGLTCTTDACVAGSGCQHVQVTPGKCCETVGDCDDGLACTGHTCELGVCKTLSLTSCCTSAADCDDGVACTADTCDLDKGQCKWSPLGVAGCCATAADCDDNSACTADSCVESTCVHAVQCCTADNDCAAGQTPASLCATPFCAGDACAYASLGGGCCKPNLYSTSFDSDVFAAGWLATPAGSAQWATGTGKTGNGLRAQTLSGQTIPGGGQVALARSPEWELPLGAVALLRFDYQLSAPSGNLRLRALTGGGSWLIWQAPQATSWTAIELDISGLAGRLATRELRLVWEYVPGAAGQAAAIDNLTLESTCAPKTCSAAADCADSLGATADTCASGKCVYTTSAAYCEVATTCNDSNPCTADVCDNQSCSHVAVSGCCLSGTECDDANPCTADSCKGNTCQHAKLPASLCCATGADCDDANPCTTDSCPSVGLACEHTETSPDCCVGDKECNDGESCTADSCVSNQCSHLNLCCSSDGDCNDGIDVCTADTCVAGLCQFTPTGAAGCCTTDLVNSDLEAGLPAGFSLAGSSAASFWQVASGKQSHSGKSALWYGNPSKGNFDDGLTNGTVTTPTYELPSQELVSLHFWVWMDTETGWFDDLTLTAECGGGSYLLWQKSSQLLFNLLAWNEAKLDLSALAGQTCAFVWAFDTLDGTANTGEGVYLDDIALTRSCAKRVCNTGADCNDQWTSSTEQCTSGLCSYALGATP